MNKVLYPEYNVDYISNVMSLRKPQKQSVKILDSILDDIELSKSVNLGDAQDNIHDVYPIFSDFEHSFMSLTLTSFVPVAFVARLVQATSEFKY